MINLSFDCAVVPDSPKFELGEVITHSRYGYRGVIVDFDLTCKAAQSWYQSNQTQPKKLQPWYHILVHGVEQVTYAAQSNLMKDESGNPIVHPMLNLFFFGLEEGKNRYLRNNLPWNPGNPPDSPPSSSPPDFKPPPVS